jgi:hypothetical protein
VFLGEKKDVSLLPRERSGPVHNLSHVKDYAPVLIFHTAKVKHLFSHPKTRFRKIGNRQVLRIEKLNHLKVKNGQT